MRYFRQFRWRKEFTCVNSRRFYCDCTNSRHRDIADVVNISPLVEVTHALFIVVKGLFYRGKLLYPVWRPTLPGENLPMVYFHRNIKMDNRIYRDKYRASEQGFWSTQGQITNRITDFDRYMEFGANFFNLPRRLPSLCVTGNTAVTEILRRSQRGVIYRGNLLSRSMCNLSWPQLLIHPNEQ